MARGFSLVLFPRFGMGEVRFEPEVKGEVGWRPDFGGMKSLGHMPPGGPPQRFPLPPRTARGGARALEVENAPLLEASHGSWKQGGARSQEEYKGARSGCGRWKSGGVRSLGSSWSQQPVENESGWFVGACSRWRVRVSRRRHELEVQLCQLCRENLRVRVGRAGESSPAA